MLSRLAGSDGSGPMLGQSGVVKARVIDQALVGHLLEAT